MIHQLQGNTLLRGDKHEGELATHGHTSQLPARTCDQLNILTVVSITEHQLDD